MAAKDRLCDAGFLAGQNFVAAIGNSLDGGRTRLIALIDTILYGRTGGHAAALRDRLIAGDMTAALWLVLMQPHVD